MTEPLDPRPEQDPAEDVSPAPREPASTSAPEAAPPAADAAREDAPSIGIDAEGAPGSAAAPAPPVPSETGAAPAPAPAEPPASARRPRRRRDALAEPPEPVLEVTRAALAAGSRRDFLLFAAGAAVTVAGAWWLLPDATRSRLLPGAHDRLDTLAARIGLTAERRERALDRALTFDDDVAEALDSKERRVRTYDRAATTPLRNNYNGRTPDPGYIAGWTLTLAGLASGRSERLTLADLVRRCTPHEQVTRLVCVEGWSAVAWWGGFRFADLLAAFPPAAGARWAALRSAVNLDLAGRPDPYYVSIDLDTARHPQTLLATHHAGRPLTVQHGAPLRLLAPMKLGLKNIKAVTDIAYTAAEPADYWNERGYSKYDGL